MKFCNMIKKYLKKVLGLDRIDDSPEAYLSYLRKAGVKVGEGTAVADPHNIQVDVSRPELLQIGENVYLHRGTVIMTHDYASHIFVNGPRHEFIPSHAKVRIGNNVWLGENVTILKGVIIGDNVLVGSGSIVTKPIPSNSVAIGSPARVICSIDDYFLKREGEYVAEAVEYAKAIMESGREPVAADFYDDYPAFVDGSNYMEYDYPYDRVFVRPEYFEYWKTHHKAPFKGFDEFMKFVKQQ